jgi:hypothetical protein
MGGIKKVEREVVRIKGRRRDKGGRVGEANQQGGMISPQRYYIQCCYGNTLVGYKLAFPLREPAAF